jgi:hypothetical protein
VPRSGADDPYVDASEYRVEGGSELAVAVADQEPEPLDVVAEVHDEVAGLLGDPGPVGWAVIPAMCTRRRPCTTTTRT